MAGQRLIRDDRGMTTISEPEGAVRLIASPTIQYGLVFAMLGSLCSGVWFFATQAATNAALGERQARFESAVAAKFEVYDKRGEQRTAAIEDISNKLARIDAQLAFFIAGFAAQGGHVPAMPAMPAGPAAKGAR